LNPSARASAYGGGRNRMLLRFPRLCSSDTTAMAWRLL
jgi:hypothetical protein